MIVLNRNQQRQPIGGHHYPEHGEMFTGETFHEVVEAVRNSRIRNGRTVGDPERDVLVWYANKFPYMVLDDGEKYEPPEEDPIYVEYRKWVHAVWRNPPTKFVTLRESDERLKTCRKCPMAKKVEFGDGDEAAELARRCALLRCGASVNESAGFCSCFLWPNDVTVFFDQAGRFSGRKKDSEVPKNCWVKTV